MLRGPRKALAGAFRGEKLPKSRELAGDVETAVEVEDKDRRLSERAELGRQLFGASWELPDQDAGRFAGAIDWSGRLRRVLSELRRSLGSEAASAIRDKLVARASAAGGEASAEQVQAAADALSEFERALERAGELLGLDPSAAFGAPGEEGYLGRVDEVTGECLAGLDGLQDWYQFAVHRARAREQGLGPLVEGLEVGDISAAATTAAFERSFYEAWTSERIRESDALREFHGDEHRRRARKFAELDRRFLDTTQALVRARVAESVPRVTAATSDTSEVGILRRELKKQRRHKPIRRLFQEIPNLLARLKPCAVASERAHLPRHHAPRGSPAASSA